MAVRTRNDRRRIDENVVVDRECDDIAGSDKRYVADLAEGETLRVGSYLDATGRRRVADGAVAEIRVVENTDGTPN